MALFGRRKNIPFIALGILFIANILVWTVVFDLNRPRVLEVNFFDVGQGDAIFVETPKRTQILIDGGPSSKIIEKLGKEMPFYDRSIDLIISTHPDSDHLSGLIDVLKRYKVNLVAFNGAKSLRPEFIEWESQILKKKIPTKVLKKSQRILIGDNLYFEILAPLENFEGREVSDFNTSSIVTKMVFGKNSFLFTADAPQSIEEKLVKENANLDYNPPTAHQGIDLNSDILKVSHHGSRTATTESFLKSVTPEIAVIQVSGDQKVKGKDCDNKERNQYGHPHCEVLERLEGYGIKVFRTDKDGDIKIVSDGNNLRITN